jgi:hypothetical protein
MRRSPLLGTLLASLLITAACGSAATRTAQGTPVDGAAMLVLAASAVPGVPSKTTVLTDLELEKEASIPGLASMMSSWGYAGGRERVFQGESRHLTLVISRSLLFTDVTGAQTFVNFVRANSGAFFGGVVETHPMVAQGRSGWLFTLPSCACHMSNPAVAGVLDTGSGVTWLEINGPDATPALLVSLLDPANSVPGTLPG